MPARGLTKTDWLERLVASLGPLYFIWQFFVPVFLGNLMDKWQDIFSRGFDGFAAVVFPCAYLAGLIALWYLLILGQEPLRQGPRLRRWCIALAIATGSFFSLWTLLAISVYGLHWGLTLALVGPVVVGLRALRRLFPLTLGSWA